MNAETRETLDNASKAMWAGDIPNAFRLLRTANVSPDENPLIYYDVLYNLALLASLLRSDEAKYYQARLDEIHGKIADAYQETQKFLSDTWKRREGGLRAKRLKMPSEKRLAYYISPRYSQRELRRDISFVRGLQVPEIRQEGRFLYSVDADLVNTIVRGYTTGTLDLAHAAAREGINIVGQERDLLQFLIPDFSAQVVSRENGVVLVSIGPGVPSAMSQEALSGIMRRLNEIFFG